ncbi:amp dependent CoA ligase [Coniophora puteana RWD-64-598 SS2]|uniref:Amp dependent CoA ligase n=1 Tax=Coniophora puteana (strain RWD-64-598) TaxID=741705 RepID=A0A5M3MQ75_CONPW|nr:amp dependent CoA ligase [Coniophora puteana RWD-64-598 SS2]EIW81329.1 amp dependent CoA ligase [Coniophora puteana RWD-64-598 SS2]
MTEIHGPPINVHLPDDLTIPQFFLDSAHSLRPKRPLGVPWMIDDKTGRKIGYEELRARTHGLANALSMRYGIGVYIQHMADYAPVVWAIHRLGAIVSTANPAYTTEELVYQIELTKATTIIAHSTSLEVAADAARQTGIPYERIVVIGDSPLRQFANVDELVKEGLAARQHYVERKLRPGEGKTKLAFLNFSSGTTGRPKAVMISHYAPIANAIQLALHARVGDTDRPRDKQRFRPGDLVSACLPFYHIYGLVIIIHSMLYCGVTLVVVPKFSFVDFLESVSRHRITHLILTVHGMLVPPIAVLLCKQDIVAKYDLSHVHYIVSGAAPLSGELVAQLADRFPNAQIGQGYGLTETSTSVSMFSPDRKVGVVGSSGTLAPGITARVVRPDGSLAGVNEPGELWLKSPALALGYYNNPEATRETFVDGWLRTGDEVRIDKDREIFVLDRLKELIKVRGFQVAPAELEGTLLMHPDIVDACVIPLPDEYNGEVPMAYVVLRPEVDERVRRDPAEATRVKVEIIQHTAENKVAYKRLAGGVEFTDVIPKNPSGKILRRVLRDRAKEKLAGMKAKL